MDGPKKTRASVPRGGELAWTAVSRIWFERTGERLSWQRCWQINEVATAKIRGALLNDPDIALLIERLGLGDPDED